MDVYEVGGAVRDALLGIEVEDRDWVVVGATADELLRLGYRPVGRDFPVFLHPRSNEQYALARTERKVAPGYTGFEVNASVGVSLEQDLARRDLTINAMAKDQHGRLIDPSGGRQDLQNRVLRHVSNAFGEDPLRVLRTARFAARFKYLEFTVAPETIRLMAEMVDAGELATLRPERVWQETLKALTSSRPDVYFEVLRECGALKQVFPEIDKLFGVPQPKRWHPEIDSGVHTLMALKLCAELTENAAVRFAVLTHDLGKATTPKSMLPAHRGHEERSVTILNELAERLPVPRRFQILAEHVARYHKLAHRAFELRPTKVFELIVAVDGLRQPLRFEEFLLACEADARGRKGFESRPYDEAGRLRVALQAALAVDSTALRSSGLQGVALGDALRELRIDAVKAALSANSAAVDQPP